MREAGPRVTGPTGDRCVEPWSQEGGLMGIREVGGQAGGVGGCSGQREPGTPSTEGKNNHQSRVARWKKAGLGVPSSVRSTGRRSCQAAAPCSELNP